MPKNTAKPKSSTNSRSGGRAKSPSKPRSRGGPGGRRFYRRPSFYLKLGMVASVLLVAFVVYYDARVRSTFDNLAWQQPAKVYARPLILAAGVALTPEELEQELELLGYRSDPRLAEPGSYLRRGEQFGLHLRAFHFADGPQPARRVNVDFRGGRVDRVSSLAGTPLQEALLEPATIGGIYPQLREDRLLIRLEETPRMLVEVLLQVEDHGFYQHHGISPRSIARAMLANLRAGRTVQGGSTITQQLVKNLMLTRQRSLWRKAQEAVMALLTELHYSKDAILEAYLNEIYLGQEGSRAIHGFGLAAHHYFNKPLAELELEQMAMLVGMVKGPSYYDPWRHPERSQKRRNLVLAELAEQGWLTPAQLETLSARPLGLTKSSAVAGVYPAYIDLVRRQLRRDYRGEDLQSQGLRIFTPFDPRIQRRAEQALQRNLAKLEERQPQLQGAMVVTGVGSGDVVALVGGRQPRFAGFNRALDALRPVGSLIKPAIYLTALSQPQHYTLASLIRDEPIAVTNPDGSLWKPGNFDNKSHGEVMLHEALAHSYNQAAAQLGLTLGLDRVADTLARLGVRRPLPQVPAMLLGAAELSPIEVAAMYQTIAADGLQMSLRAIYAITDSRGQLLARYPQQPQQTVDAAAVHLLQYALIETMREGTGRGAYQRLPQDFRVAGKTGTSNDFRDSWFAGFAGDYLSVVWMGRDDNAPTGLTGSSGALRAWRDFMADVSREPMPFTPTAEVSYSWVDGRSGLLSKAWCDGSRNMPFIGGSAPQRKAADCRRDLPRLWRWFTDALD